MLDIIEHNATLGEATQEIIADKDVRLDLLSAGSDGVRLRGVFDTVEVADLFRELSENYDVIVVDIPPLLNVSYAAQLLRAMDGAVVVASSGSSERFIGELRDRLRFVGANVIGFIYNRGPLRPERTASIAAVHYDLGGKRTSRSRWAKRRLRRDRATRKRTNAEVDATGRF
jgi:Mrp family chromosome partitioning ATPase